MATEQRIVVPTDMGKTIELGTIEQDKWNVKVDGTTVQINEEGQLTSPGTGGLDCAAIGALPKKPWAKGTTLLARGADGECHQLSVLDSIFQEVGVGITANKTTGLTNEKYHVVVTVTNTGEGTNDRTALTIVRPQLGAYNVTDFTTSKSGAEITRTDDWNYVITDLTKGGTVKVEFDVTPTGPGTLQFGAAVDPNSALDQQSTNNQASIILSAVEPARPEDPTYVPSNECPAVVVKHGNETLFTGLDAVNVFLDRTTLRGVTLTTENVGTVAVIIPLNSHDEQELAYTGARSTLDKKIEALVSKSRNRIVIPGKSLSFAKSDSTSPIRKGISYKTSDNKTTFVNNTLTVTADVQSLLIALRPANTDCKWQYLVLNAASELSETPSECNYVMSGNSVNPIAETDVRVIPWGGGKPPSKGLLSASDDFSYGLTSIKSFTHYPLTQTKSSMAADVLLNTRRIKTIGNLDDYEVVEFHKNAQAYTISSFAYTVLPVVYTFNITTSTTVKEVHIKPGETITLTGCGIPSVTSQGRLAVSKIDNGLRIAAAADATTADFIRSDNGALLIRVV